MNAEEISSQTGPAGGCGAAMLEVMNRRYYKIRTLENVQLEAVGGRPGLTGDFELCGERLYLLSTVADHDDLAERPGRDRRRGPSGSAAGQNLVTDLYLALGGRAGGPGADLRRAACGRCRSTAAWPPAAGSP